MKSISCIKRILTLACVVFTILTAGILLISLLISTDTSPTTVSQPRILLLLPFSLIFGIACEILKVEKLHAVIRFLLHAVLTVSSFCLFVLPQESASASSAFLRVFTVAVVYLLVFGIVFFFRSRFRKQTERQTADKPTYTSQFGKERDGK